MLGKKNSACRSFCFFTSFFFCANRGNQLQFIYSILLKRTFFSLKEPDSQYAIILEHFFVTNFALIISRSVVKCGKFRIYIVSSDF